MMTAQEKVALTIGQLIIEREGLLEQLEAAKAEINRLLKKTIKNGENEND